MTFDYAEFTELADEILREFGAALTLRRESAGAYDTSSGSVTLTPGDSTLYGALFDIGKGVVAIRTIAVTADDKQCLLSATGAAPQVGDIILDSAGVQYTILSVGVIKPAGLAVLYDLHLHR